MRKERLHEAAHGIGDELGGVHHYRPCAVGPARHTREGEGGIESGAGDVGVVEGRSELQLGNLHVGTAGKHLHRHAGGEAGGEGVGVEGGAGDGVRGFVEDHAKRVFRLANAVLERGNRGLQFIEVGACLRNGGVGGQACLMHGFHSVDVFLPEYNRFIGGAELFVEHLQRVVEVGNG